MFQILLVSFLVETAVVPYRYTAKQSSVPTEALRLEKFLKQLVSTFVIVTLARAQLD